MSSEIFKWIHFSDLHAGLSAEQWLWPSFKTKFFDDLSVQFAKSGPWDAVLFTGDLTQAARRAEFDRLDEILDEIWEKFHELGTNPTLITIPGNHDLARPDELASHAIAIKNYWETPQLRDGLFVGKADEYLDFLRSVFAEYAEWRTRQIDNGRHESPVCEGILPGDASYRLSKCDNEIGIVGLNSAWLQIGAGDFIGKLGVDVRQLLAVTYNDPDKWCRENLATFLMTHHPVDWLHDLSAQCWPSDVDANQRFDLHLFGHMHDHDIKAVSRGGGQQRRSAQASSLLGLDTFGGSAIKRIQGYSLNQLSEGQGFRQLKVWPRILHPQKDGDRKLTSDTSQGLTDDQHYSLRYEPLARLDTELLPIDADRIKVSLTSKPEEITADLQKIRYYVPDEPAHGHVRRVELHNASNAFSQQRILWLISDWGMGEDGFLNAIQAQFGELGCATYRFDLGDYKTRDQFLADTQEKFGVSFEVLCANIATMGSSYILFNDIPFERDVVPGTSPIEVDIESIAQIIKEFSPSTKVALRASRTPRRQPLYPVVELKALDEADVALYLRNSGRGGDELTNANFVNTIYRHTDGVPSRIDVALRELEVSSLETVVRVNADLGDRMLPAVVPPALVAAIGQIESAQKDGPGYPFELLKALASLPRGDQIEGIERLNGPKPFRPRDALVLSDRGLIDSVLFTGIGSQHEGTSSKTLMVPRPVREYVRSQMTDNEAESLDRKLIELYFGNKWKTGRITGSRAGRSAADSLCDMHVIINCCTLIIRHVRQATEAGNQIEIEAGIRLSSDFVERLIKGSHHRAAAALCADIIQLIRSEGYDDQIAILEYERARSLRMTTESAEARDIILNLDFSLLSKSQKQTAKVTLALAYMTLGDSDKAAHAAREAIRIDGRSAVALQARSILIEQTEDPAQRLKELSQLRLRSGKKEAFVNSNNIAITMARQIRLGDKSEAKRLLREVIESSRHHKDFYNGARAIADLAALQKKDEPCGFDDKLRLIDAYHFAHNERQQALFDQCHSGLWKVFEAEGDIENLLSLYRSSSFIWRINGRDDTDMKYLAKLKDFRGRMVRATRDREYFFVRVFLVLGESNEGSGEAPN